MASRVVTRSLIVGCAAWRMLLQPRRRQFPDKPNRILIAHDLLLGDTLVLTPLLAKLRQHYPQAEINLLVRPAFAPLFQRQPYGVRSILFNPKDLQGISKLVGDKRGFDLALVPGDNRYSWLAKAMGAKWIVGFGGDRPASKNWPLDQLLPIPAQPATWGELITELVPGLAPPPYEPVMWPEPECRPFTLPESAYCVLHVGASSPLKLWDADKWSQLAVRLERCGYQIVWSGGANEQKIVSAIDPQARFKSYAGQLDLAQMWHLLKNASLLVCPDTGIAHLGRLIGVPTVALFGPGSPLLFGAGQFWRNSPYLAVTIDDIPCRNQNVVFRRQIAWVKRCNRGYPECQKAICMDSIEIRHVWQAITKLVDISSNQRSESALR